MQPDPDRRDQCNRLCRQHGRRTISTAQNNYAALSIDYNNVRGNLQVNNNTAATDVSGNTVAK